ncbi:hypothetical protein Q8F55_007842 [Vanrija albida]|uniref:Glycosyl hydrolase family 13 catalytic domain-containing protein n=1 Tax=Vanrija albida TaxID=181172 RepID=A0ABR3PVP1_9TREE
MTVITETQFVANADIPRAWWKSAVVYQIYPASFLDTNGDGVGDLRGVINKLDYLKNLGVDVIWLSPIFKSPQVDMGYDISDYRDIHAPYGTVADVDELIAELHKRGMKLVLDLVVNHTSDQHAWFLESKSSKTNPKRDWYYWRPAKVDADGNKKEPNNWQSVFGGSTWKHDETTDEYFLHYFDESQPDLNFENVEVRQAVYDLMKFWLDKGADGYRMDVIARISKNVAFPDAPEQVPGARYQDFDRRAGPRLHEFLQEMNREVLSKYDCLTVGELNFVDPKTMLNFVHPDRKEIQTGFSFDHVNVGLKGMGLGRHLVNPWTLPEWKDTITRWQWLREAGGWHALYLENHDQPRSISRFGDDSPEWRWASGRVLALLHTTLFGTVYLYQGEEIGMINVPLDWPIEDYQDVQTQILVKEINETCENPAKVIQQLLPKMRDHPRTPMQWTAEAGAGFSTAKPWMRLPEDFTVCNVEAQVNDPKSLFSFWKSVLAFRREHEDALVYGSYRELSHEDEAIFAYVRDDKFLVVLNFSKNQVVYSLPEKFSSSKFLISTTEESEWPATLGDKLALPPWTGAVYEVSKQ